MDRLTAQIAFIVEIDKLKQIFRQNVLTDGSRRENDAEHSWHMATMAVVLAEYADPATDLARVIRMLLIHDLVEIDAGDTFLYDAAAGADQMARERAAAERLFGLLPADQAQALRALWDEFEARETLDARFARALDRLQPMILNHHSQGGSWRQHGITADQVIGPQGDHRRGLARPLGLCLAPDRGFRPARLSGTGTGRRRLETARHSAGVRTPVLCSAGARGRLSRRRATT